ncbi:HEAT repeat domain-containing protein [Singulisphaera sp. Ch08]|uniref:HEAT repeat domain-containing protein n=1 Tax=Singulisphaera sp. Ch08 TaxID=3120278 RepID=A0AAU7CA93_9BACT
MSLVQLTLLALLGLAADPAALVGDLSSPKEAVRLEAAGALEQLGRPALPSLYRVRDSDDPELRRQVAKLIDLIERQRLLQATKVRLDFEDKTLAEVAEALKAQTGVSVVLGPDEALRTRRVTLHAKESVPFWNALDRVGATCGVRHNPGLPFSISPREPTILLGLAEGPPVPASDAGPFRVYLVRLGRHREVTPAKPPAKVKSHESLTVDFQLIAEPGLAVNQIGPVVLDEAVDDRGRDLRLDPPVGPHPTRVEAPKFGEGHASLISLKMPLKTLDGPGGRLRRIKGHVPISVIARAGDPIVVPLAGEEGKTYTKAGISLKVTDIGRAGKDTTFTLLTRGEPVRQRRTPQQEIPWAIFSRFTGSKTTSRFRTPKGGQSGGTRVSSSGSHRT